MSIYRFYAGVFILLTIILVAGCTSYSLAANDVVGTYKIDYTNRSKKIGSETLILRAGRNYEQHYTDEKGKSYSRKGRWDYRQPGTDKEQVFLSQALSPFDYSSGLKRPPIGDRFLFAYSHCGKVHLRLRIGDSDEYNKIR